MILHNKVQKPFFEPDCLIDTEVIIMMQIKCRSCRQVYDIDERIMSCIRCRSGGKIVMKPKDRPSGFVNYPTKT